MDIHTVFHGKCNPTIHIDGKTFVGTCGHNGIVVFIEQNLPVFIGGITPIGSLNSRVIRRRFVFQQTQHCVFGGLALRKGAIQRIQHLCGEIIIVTPQGFQRCQSADIQSGKIVIRAMQLFQNRTATDIKSIKCIVTLRTCWLRQPLGRA